MARNRKQPMCSGSWIVFAMVLISIGALYFAYVQYARRSQPVVLEKFADLGNSLFMNQSMSPLEALTSTNRLYKMVYTEAGEISLVRVANGKVLWSTESVKKDETRPGKLKMHSDGNIILYDADDKIYWTSKSNMKGQAPYRMELQNNGSLAIFDGQNKKIWTTEKNEVNTTTGTNDEKDDPVAAQPSTSSQHASV